jgi:hypothetical protein
LPIQTTLVPRKVKEVHVLKNIHSPRVIETIHISAVHHNNTYTINKIHFCGTLFKQRMAFGKMEIATEK